MKRCTRCKIEKPLSDFTSEKRGKYGVKSRCKPCEYLRAREYDASHREERRNAQKKRYQENPERRREIWEKWRKGHPEAWRAGHLRRKYGLRDGEYEAIFEAQRGACAICGNTQKGKHLAVDHDHTTGAVRGLLCEHCNHLLGYMRDDPATIQSAIDYLAKFNMQKVGEMR